jgi:hypothetical protein
MWRDDLADDILEQPFLKPAELLPVRTVPGPVVPEHLQFFDQGLEERVYSEDTGYFERLFDKDLTFEVRTGSYDGEDEFLVEVVYIVLVVILGVLPGKLPGCVVAELAERLLQLFVFRF